MIITFSGHADFCDSKECKGKLLAFLEEKVKDKPCYFYLGNQGFFDAFAYACCKEYKERHPDVMLVLVTPYFSCEYQEKHLKEAKNRYDLIIYPEIEKVPKRFAIIARNEYMVENADFLVAYVSHSWGGAYKTYQYAKKKGKTIFNLSTFNL